ncbi:hypothetical protein HanXRQr2_Chr01g0045141 [Helianthus annuus]|uniref:Uncharacterized protein n=1 Tax=Helianthus annuus TaxID=4232 RepID=A0A251VT23_HELAN|nr:hypothetical protein HanXRQr2_Chr01g0045141 [Helianthus annuus]KAJ0625117.1 hypothetical protein HanIR_Chr01g0050291 [Helianthus annuus]KAJ0958983.1 hypothetical protein HanPSC8_Chr01g0044881 [Helianthus annuus]
MSSVDFLPHVQLTITAGLLGSHASATSDCCLFSLLLNSDQSQTHRDPSGEALHFRLLVRALLTLVFT